jgi:O-methyltransferase
MAMASKAKTKLIALYPSSFVELYLRIKPFSMVGAGRSYELYKAVNRVCASAVTGDFVECGVWKGGQSMLAALTFMQNDWAPRLRLYDTFEGMPRPAPVDISNKDGKPALDKWKQLNAPGGPGWAVGSLKEVMRNMASTGYPADKVRYYVGDVAVTLKEDVPESISILRLDTDWYTSTKKELEVLFPRLSSGGVLMVDDYGSWRGSQLATTEYFSEHGFDDVPKIRVGNTLVIIKP